MKVTYVDHMGTDLSVVNAARVSFAKASNWVEDCPCQTPGDKECKQKCRFTLGERDRKLTGYLAREGHWTPFAHTSITVHVKAPVFVRTQCFKHKQGFVENEVSRRYVDDPPEFYVPKEWRKRPEGGIKQGSSEETLSRWSEQFLHVVTTSEASLDDTDQVECVFDYDDIRDLTRRMYQHLLDEGVAPEMARMVLPQSMYTEWYWTGSLAAFARFYRLRVAKDAQKEIQELALQVGRIIEPLFPVSWGALTDCE